MGKQLFVSAIRTDNYKLHSYQGATPIRLCIKTHSCGFQFGQWVILLLCLQLLVYGFLSGNPMQRLSA